MTRSELGWTDSNVDEATKRSERWKDQALKRAEKCIADVEHDRRITMKLCPHCYYFRRGGISGRGFTSYTCVSCGIIGNHPNTNTPMVCEKCSHERQICVKCGGRLDP